MEKHPQNVSSSEKRPIVSIRLLVVSLTIYVLAFFIGTLGPAMGIEPHNKWTMIWVMIFVGLALNLVGLVAGILERKKNFESSVDGIVGNLIPILLLLIVIGVIMYYASQFSRM